MALTREQIDKAPVTVEEVPVPELVKGETVFVRVCDPEGVEQLAEYAEKAPKETQTERIAFLYEVLARTVCDKRGKLLYEPGEGSVIRKTWRSFRAVERVADAALRLNGMDDASIAEREKELTRPLAGSSLRSRGNGTARTKKRKPSRHRAKSSSASR